MTDTATDVDQTVNDLERFMRSPKYAEIVDRVAENTYTFPVPSKELSHAIYALISHSNPIGVSLQVPHKFSLNSRISIRRFGDICSSVRVQLFPSERIESATVRIRVTDDKSKWVDFGNYATIEGSSVVFDPPLPTAMIYELGLEIRIACENKIQLPPNNRRDCLVDYVFIRTEIRDELSCALHPNMKRVRASDFTLAYPPDAS